MYHHCNPSGETLCSILFPQATNEVVSCAPVTTQAEMEAAVDAAAQAFPAWSEQSILSRQQIMFNLQHLVKNNMVGTSHFQGLVSTSSSNRAYRCYMYYFMVKYMMLCWFSSSWRENDQGGTVCAWENILLLWSTSDAAKLIWSIESRLRAMDVQILVMWQVMANLQCRHVHMRTLRLLLACALALPDREEACE